MRRRNGEAARLVKANARALLARGAREHQSPGAVRAADTSASLRWGCIWCQHRMDQWILPLSALYLAPTRPLSSSRGWEDLIPYT